MVRGEWEGMRDEGLELKNKGWGVRGEEVSGERWGSGDEVIREAVRRCEGW